MHCMFFPLIVHPFSSTQINTKPFGTASNNWNRSWSRCKVLPFVAMVVVDSFLARGIGSEAWVVSTKQFDFSIACRLRIIFRMESEWDHGLRSVIVIIIIR
jgi:hypothetical protein